MSENVELHFHKTMKLKAVLTQRMGYIPYKMTMSPISKRRLQLCAFMVRGGKVITPIRFCGHASPHLHFFNFNSMKVTPTRHAEIGAINGLKYKQRQSRSLKKTTLIVVRFSQKNITDHSFEMYLSNSKPCKQCIKVLKRLQLKAIIYVNQNGTLIKQKPNDIDDCVDSGGTCAHLSS